MATSDLQDVQDQIQELWAPKFTAELRESFVLPSLIDRTYDVAELVRQNDTINVSQVNAPNGFLLNVAKDATNQACEFDSEAISTSQIAILIDKRAGQAYEFCDLVELQSQISMTRPDVTGSAVFAMNKQVNTHIYSLVDASTTAPDHLLGGTATLNADILTTLTKLADEAFWPEGQRWLLVDPTYHKDLLDATTLVSSDFVGDQPVVGGNIVTERFGWKIVKDNSAALKATVGTGTAGAALAFIPEFMHMVTQRTAQVKISDLHSNKQFGTLMSIDMVFGAKLGINADNKHIEIRVAA